MFLNLNIRQPIVLFILMLYGTALSAQEMNYGSWSLHVTPTQFVFKEIPVTVEKFIGSRNTIGLHFAYKFGKNISRDSMRYRSINHFYFMGEYNARTIALSTKWYFDHYKIKYFDLVLFNRYWWYDKVSYVNNGIPLTTQDKMNVWGMKLIMGTTVYSMHKSRFVPYANLYAGIGIRFKAIQSEIFDSNPTGVFINYSSDYQEGLLPSIQAGVNVGLMHYPPGKQKKDL